MNQNRPTFNNLVDFLFENFSPDALESIVNAINRRREVLREGDGYHTVHSDSSSNHRLSSSTISPGDYLDQDNEVYSSPEVRARYVSQKRKNNTIKEPNIVQNDISRERGIAKPGFAVKKAYVNVAAFLNIDPINARMYRTILRDIMTECGIDLNQPYSSQERPKILSAVRKMQVMSNMKILNYSLKHQRKKSR
ncbi:uncharacterized protein VTP21DRAFT_9690 [Calcarisporiella thermophila]|uniref:uncharacterized protein n=1 Tax=Calcarisporiella thermophila TaxID=911321 RepID=UPI003742EB3D